MAVPIRDAFRAERGASAILIAMTMVLLMGVAAVVIDGGMGFSERRQAQAAVDFASLAALHASVGANPEDAGAAEAITVAEANLPGRNLQAWAACTDPTRPPEYTIVSSLSPCVSFTENFSQARVQLPLDTLDNTFGKVIGFATLDVTAQAEAEQHSLANSDVLPYTAGPGSLVCLFSNQAPQSVAPCSGPFNGFFGYLDAALFGSSQLGNPWTCEQGTSNVRSAVNIAKGADHLMAEWDSGDPILNDHTECANLSEDINQLVVQPGSPTQGSDDGLINGVSGSINGQPFTAAPGRLEPSSTATESVRGMTLDDTPLWTYLTDDSCPWSIGITGDVDTHIEMETCLADWDPTVGSIFSVALDDHPRFGAVPIFTSYPTGAGSYLIDEFAPVWIETVYFDCNSGGGPGGAECHTIFSPGEVGGNNPCPSPITDLSINCGLNHTQHQDDIEAVTALRMEIQMLHLDTQEFFPGSESLREVSLLR